jgi:hypothetical protein
MKKKRNFFRKKNVIFFGKKLRKTTALNVGKRGQKRFRSVAKEKIYKKQ